MTKVEHHENRKSEEKQSLEQIGILVGVTETETVIMNGKDRVKKFQSVLIEDVVNEHEIKHILARVDRTRTSSSAATAHLGFNPAAIPDYETIYESMEAVSDDDTRDKGYEGILKIEGYLEYLKQGKVVLPDTPPNPFSKVFTPSLKDLNDVYSPSNRPEFVRFASLVHEPTVKVAISYNEIVSSRLGIFGISGNGKTTLILNILKGISEIGGTAIVLDTQGDYTTLANSDFSDSLNVIAGKIPIKNLGDEAFATLIGIGKNSDVQREVFRFAFNHTMTNLEEIQYWDVFYANLEASSDKADKNGKVTRDKKRIEAADRVRERCNRYRKLLSNILLYGDNDASVELKTDMINIIDLTQATDNALDKAADYYLTKIFEERKERVQLEAINNNGDTRHSDHEYGTKGGEFPTPMVIVLEEAQELIPAEGGKRTLGIASTIAKQGRKFNVGLIISSQQPTKIDEHVLSQLSSYAIGRLKNDTDQDYVLKCSPSLSRDLIVHTPNLGIGQFICAGPAFNNTAFVQADNFANRKIGGNVDCVKIWRERKLSKEHSKKIDDKVKKFKETSTSYIPDGYIIDDEDDDGNGKDKVDNEKKKDKKDKVDNL